MPIVTLRDVHKSFGPEVVLDAMSLELHDREKVGMVGANGSGKTTILKLILGEIHPDFGHVHKRKGLRIGYLPQEPTFEPGLTVMQVMHGAAERLQAMETRLHEAAEQLQHLTGARLNTQMKLYDRLCHDFQTQGGYDYQSRIESTLAALGFEERFYGSAVSTLSGGQLSRLGLARVLLMETDLLLLDEPTNHLDLQATEWLERFLLAYAGAAVVISHDRYLLDRIACKIVEIENCRARVWGGNYSTYAETKQTVLLQQQREHAARVEFVERTRDFIARNKDQEGMRKTARGRKRRLERLLKQNPDFLDAPAQSKTLQFAFGEVKGRSELVLRCSDLAMQFGDVRLFDHLSFDVLRGERLGITGPNGTGKTTLIRLALRQLEPTGGEIRLGPTLSVGYLDQQGTMLDPDKTVFDEIRTVRPELTPEQVRSRVGNFLFCGEDVFKKTAELSGGQQSRLVLCKLVMTSPDVLILDEPTNHLDIPSKEVLEQALSAYEGTLIVVSHDRFFLDRVADRLLVIGLDEIGRRCLGRTQTTTGHTPYSRFAETIRRNQQSRTETAAKPEPARPRPAPQQEPRKRTAPELRPFNKYSVEQLEEMILEHEQRLERLREGFGEERIYRDPGLLAEHQRSYDACKAELELLYRAYEGRIA